MHASCSSELLKRKFVSPVALCLGVAYPTLPRTLIAGCERRRAASREGNGRARERETKRISLEGSNDRSTGLIVLLSFFRCRGVACFSPREQRRRRGETRKHVHRRVACASRILLRRRRTRRRRARRWRSRRRRRRRTRRTFPPPRLGMPELRCSRQLPQPRMS